MTARTRHLATAVALAVVILEPILFAGSFAGDAQVHLVFAENAAHGRFFEFNPGERVSGETSPGYMLLGAAMFRALPARWVPVALKVVGLFAWYLLCWLVYLVARRLFAPENDRERFWPAIAGIVAACIPGSVYNANVGMENGIFAAIVWLWIDLAIRCGWFVRAGGGTHPDRPFGHELALATLLGVACWLRPEGFVILALAYSVRYWIVRPPRRSWVAGLLIAAGIGAASIAFQWVWTGDLLATSILSRRILTMRRSICIGPLTIDPTFAERLLLYFPLSALFLASLSRGPSNRRADEIVLLVLLGIFFILYTFVTGAAQLARYAIFLMPIIAIGAVRGARTIWRQERRYSRALLGLAAVIFGVTNIGESLYRRSAASQDLLGNAMSAPDERRQRTDDLIQQLGASPKRPLVLAVEPVQMRYELDDRIVVRSMDGRVDRALLSFVRDGVVDHIGYLKHRGVDAFVIPPVYNRNRSARSLADLSTLKPGETVRQDGLTIRRRTPWLFAVEKTDPTTF